MRLSILVWLAHLVVGIAASVANHEAMACYCYLGYLMEEITGDNQIASDCKGTRTGIGKQQGRCNILEFTNHLMSGAQAGTKPNLDEAVRIAKANGKLGPFSTNMNVFDLLNVIRDAEQLNPVPTKNSKPLAFYAELVVTQILKNRPTPDSMSGFTKDFGSHLINTMRKYDELEKKDDEITDPKQKTLTSDKRAQWKHLLDNLDPIMDYMIAGRTKDVDETIYEGKTVKNNKVVLARFDIILANNRGFGITDRKVMVLQKSISKQISGGGGSTTMQLEWKVADKAQTLEQLQGSTRQDVKNAWEKAMVISRNNRATKSHQALVQALQEVQSSLEKAVVKGSIDC